MNTNTVVFGPTDNEVVQGKKRGDYIASNLDMPRKRLHKLRHTVKYSTIFLTGRFNNFLKIYNVKAAKIIMLF